jgi:hypothetical protein
MSSRPCNALKGLRSAIYNTQGCLPDMPHMTRPESETKPPSRFKGKCPNFKVP